MTQQLTEQQEWIQFINELICDCQKLNAKSWDGEEDEESYEDYNSRIGAAYEVEEAITQYEALFGPWQPQEEVSAAPPVANEVFALFEGDDGIPF